MKQRLKSGNAGMIHNSVIGVGHAGKRTAEPMVQRISRGQYHDMPPDPAQGEGVRRILTGFRADDPGQAGLYRARGQQRPRTIHHVRPSDQPQRFGVLRKADAARHDVNAPSFRIHSVAVHSLQSFLPSRKYVRPIVPLYSGSACSPLLAVGASGEEAEAWEGSLCPEKIFPFFSGSF